MLQLSQQPEADRLLADDPLALLIGMVLDQQIPLERAFAAPLELSRRLGAPLSAASLAAMDPAALVAAFSERPALHRFPAAMAERVGALARLVVDAYGGEAAAVWTTARDGRELLARVRALPGFGEQKARIFVALLAKQLDVRPPGWRESAGKFGKPGTRMSIADIDGPESLAEVRAYKANLKAAAKSLAGLEVGEKPAGKAGGKLAGTRAASARRPARATGGPRTDGPRTGAASAGRSAKGAGGERAAKP